MKFLADMGISPQTVAFLVSLKHEAKHLTEDGLEKFSDSRILEKHSKELKQGSIISIAEGQVRVRQLPLSAS